MSLITHAFAHNDLSPGFVASPPPGRRKRRQQTQLRSRKAGSGNIFSNVNLWQLQRLFRAAGDHDAEQRAKLVWGLGDEADLAQALIGLRARSHRKRLRTNERSGTAERPVPVSSGLRRGGESNPDRYLHQILH
uniref:Arginine vasopressin-induced protein 1 n=1 Tax=Oryzias latipes TaxID=8090 RepID=A0A3P9LQW2_ORYLA